MFKLDNIAESGTLSYAPSHASMALLPTILSNIHGERHSIFILPTCSLLPIL